MENLPANQPSRPSSGLPSSELGNSAALWKLLWDFDPNGLLVLDDTLRVILVNPAMCQMLKIHRDSLLGCKAADLLGNVSDFARAYAEQRQIVGQEVSYPRFDLHVRKLIFPVPDEKSSRASS